ncbi:25140_t:CDS:2, partial [Gigaspora rosea]
MNVVPEEKINSAWCKECGVKFLENNFNNWTSGDQIIDDTIKKIQKKSSLPIDFVEWIPYEQLEKGENIGCGGFGDIYSAFWKQGPISMHGNEFKRTRGVKVALKRLMDNDIEKYKSELCMHINCCTNLNIYTTRTQFRTSRSPILRCYGLTKDDEGYMLVMQLAKYDICGGTRPQITEGTPPCYVKLMQRCWDPEPEKRPSSSEIYDIVCSWYYLKNYKEFKAADKAQNIQKIQIRSSILPHNTNIEFSDNTWSGFPDNTSLESPDKQNCIENSTNSNSTTSQFR